MVKLWRYSEILRELGLEQLDVYRFKDHDEIRVRDRESGRVLLIKLPRHRESIPLEEFRKIVIEKLKSIKG